MTTKTIDIELNLKQKSGDKANRVLKGIQTDLDKTGKMIDHLAAKSNEASLKVVKGFQNIETQSNRTREKMEKLAQVGTRLAFAGGALLAPLGLAFKKYLDTAKDTEPISRRILELSKKWEVSQVKLGKIVAEYVLPALEKGAVILDKVIAFAEKNPGVVKAALTIGTTLVVLGGLIATTAQLVATIATIQGLAASAGLAAGGGGAIAGGAAAGVGGVALGATVGAAVVTGIAAWAGANLGLIITNALTGQNYTMTDLGNTVKTILALNAKGIDWLIGYFGGDTNFFGAVSNALGITAAQQARINQQITENQTAQIAANANANTSAQMQNASANTGGLISALTHLKSFLFGGGKASGGYVTNGLYRLGEQGREYVLNSRMTKYFERLFGGQVNNNRFAELLEVIEGKRRRPSSGISGRAGRPTLNGYETISGIYGEVTNSASWEAMREKYDVAARDKYMEQLKYAYAYSNRASEAAAGYYANKGYRQSYETMINNFQMGVGGQTYAQMKKYLYESQKNAAKYILKLAGG